MLLCVFALLASCKQEESYVISGKWEQGNGTTIYLKRMISKEELIPVDSVVVNGGQFVLSGKLPEIDRYRLEFDNSREDIFLDGTPLEVKIVTKVSQRKGKENKYNDITVSGGAELEILKAGKTLSLTKTMIDFGSLMMMAEVKDDSLKLDSIWKETENMKKLQAEQVQVFLDTNRNSLAIPFFIEDFVAKNYPIAETEYYYEQLEPRVKAAYPGRKLLQTIESLRSVNVGAIAPDIDLPTPDGQTIKLSSLRGKYVLLDFWASWCGPCLREVPNLKEIYKQYHDKGLEIYGVSLDDDREKWTNSIEQHEIHWIHVSSLKGWKCPVVARYNITGIPQMYLLDKEGKIIAQNLRGEKLKEMVASFFID